MIANQNEAVEMEFNGYNYKAEWTIPNFISLIDNSIESPLFWCDDFQVHFITRKNIDTNNDSFDIGCNFSLHPNKFLYFEYTIIIENTNYKKSKRIHGTKDIYYLKGDFTINCNTKLNEITEENGFLKDNSLHLTFFINPIFQHLSEENPNKPTILNTNRNVVNQSDWLINEKVGDFYLSKTPIEISIKEKKLNFSTVFEKYDQNSYLFSIYLNNPTFYFIGELNIILINQNDTIKNISKSEHIEFDSNQFDITPIQIELKEDDVMNLENGWIYFDSQSNEMKTNFHFTIQFLQSQKDDKESFIFDLLANSSISSEKKIRESPPITIQPLRGRKFNLNIEFTDIQNKNLNDDITSPEYHTGVICFNLTVNLNSKTLIMNLTDFVQRGGILSGEFTFVNQNPSNSKTEKTSFMFCQSNKVIIKNLPYSIEEILNPMNGWLINGSLRVNIDLNCECSKDFLYPIRIIPGKRNAVHTFRYLIPISFFSTSNVKRSIEFPPLLVGKNGITPSIKFDFDHMTQKLTIKTNFHLGIHKEAVSNVYLIAEYENKNKINNFSCKLKYVNENNLQMPDFSPNESLKKDEFTFLDEDETKEFVHLCIKCYSI